MTNVVGRNLVSGASVALLVGVLAAGTAAGVAVPGGAASAATFEPATCTAPVSQVVRCQLPTVAALPGFNLETLVSEADAVNGAVSTSTPMVVTAVGAGGGKGGSPEVGSAGSGGAGGVAQTTTTVLAYEQAHGSPAIYYYLGRAGTGTKAGGLGGASTVVASANLTTVTPCIDGWSSCTSTNVLVDAGGGGGGGEGRDLRRRERRERRERHGYHHRAHDRRRHKRRQHRLRRRPRRLRRLQRRGGARGQRRRRRDDTRAAAPGATASAARVGPSTPRAAPARRSRGPMSART